MLSKMGYFLDLLYYLLNFPCRYHFDTNLVTVVVNCKNDASGLIFHLFVRSLHKCIMLRGYSDSNYTTHSFITLVNQFLFKSQKF